MDPEYMQTIDNLECILPIAKDIIAQYCADHHVEDDKRIQPTMWNDILDEICQRIFVFNKKILKDENGIRNEYDKDKVIYIYERVYVKLCNQYVQEICQQGFVYFSGIDKQTLYNWSSERLGSSRFDLQQRIKEDNEHSLWSLMLGSNGHPMKFFGKLNKYHGWNGGGTTNEGTKRAVLTASELPRLGAEMSADGEQNVLKGPIIADKETGENS